MSHPHRLSATILAGALALAPALYARTCTGNADVIGGYGYTASRAAEFVPAPTAPPVTPIAGSVTAIGGFVSGAANSIAFASVGRLFLDGNGGIFSSATPGATLTQVGTYTVNGDCTASATFIDAFATPGGAGLTPIQATVTFEGVVVQNTNEIDLVQTGAAAGTQVTLKKARQFLGCSNDGLTGTFGLAAAGVATVPSATAGGTPTSTAFSLYGRMNLDGQGNLVSDSVSASSPLSKRQITGTYLVNPDCTGAATLTSADGKSRKVNFVIVSPTGAGQSQALLMSFGDSGVVGSGFALQQ